MSRLSALFFATVLSFVAAGCDDSTGITEAEIACPTGSTLTYASYGQAVIDRECLDCHTSRERPHLATQADVQAHANEIIRAAVFHSGMPEDGDMTNEERITLGQWLRCGAP